MPTVIPGGHKIDIEMQASAYTRSIHDAAGFTSAMQRWLKKKYDFDRIPPIYKRFVEEMRLKLDILTDDERLSAGENKKKRKGGHLGLRPKKPAPDKVLVMFDGSPLDIPSISRVTTDVMDLGTDFTTTFGGTSTFSLLSTGAQEEPLLTSFGPLPLPHSYVPSAAKFGAMTYDPVGIPAPFSCIKSVLPQEIDRKRLGLWAGRRRQDYGGQQITVMNGCSAGVYAQWVISAWVTTSTTHLALDSGAWEWLHLVAFSMGGIEHAPQQAANLVAGTVHANTEMMLYENAIKRLVEETNTSLWVGVSAKLTNHTHLAESITYTVTRKQSGKADIPIVFHTNPLKMDAPGHGLETIVYETMKLKLFK